MANAIHKSTVPDEENLFLIACKEADKLPLMGSPWPVLIIVSSYLVFVIKVGKIFMRDRKPFNIKYIMLVYNFYQALSNAYLVSALFTTKGALGYLWKHCCHPMDPAQNPYWLTLNHVGWLYFFSKVADLLDTVFFILRKKQSHVTFLHVYHHANMVLSSWIYLKYIKGEQGVVIGVINSSVHVVMYTYYFLSALGPEMQKYLWWKKYITKMQMAQFVIIMVYMGGLLMAKCELPKLLSWYTISQAFVFFLLFANFYVRTYIVGAKKAPTKKPTENGSVAAFSSSSTSPVAGKVQKDKLMNGHATHEAPKEKLMNGHASKLKAN